MKKINNVRIALINIDSKLPNLALKKLEVYYSQKGYKIFYDLPINSFPLLVMDKVYVSCIFSINKEKAKEYERYANTVIGGSGYSLEIKLEKEIYDIKPRINYDFATRGCIRKCSFCIVPNKEGKIKIERDLYDIWDGNSKEITFLDNNILAAKNHFNLICEQAQKEKIKIDFNQGLDIRLVDDEIAYQLSKTKMKDIRFALDNVKTIPLFREKLKILRRYLPKKYFFIYVLSGYNSTFEEDLERLEFLKSEKCRPYLMRHENVKGNKRYHSLARWVNQPYLFALYSWEKFLEYEKEYIKNKHHKSMYKLFY